MDHSTEKQLDMLYNSVEESELAGYSIRESSPIISKIQEQRACCRGVVCVIADRNFGFAGDCTALISKSLYTNTFL